MSARVMYLVGVGCFTYFILFHIYAGIQLKREKGYFWSKQDSAYYKDDGSIDWLLVKIILGRSAFSVTLFSLLFVIMYTSRLSGISSSIIISLYAANILTTSFGFYLVFNENLTSKHLIGMICIIISIVLISFGKSTPADGTSTDSDLKTEKISVLIPIGLALLVCLVITGQSLISRAIRYTKMSSAQYTADSQCLSNLLLCVLGVYEHVFVQEYETKEASVLIAISFLQIIGLLCLNGAIIFGKAGPSQALIQLQSPL